MRRPVDLMRARRALRRLDELARQHPEAFDPSRLPTTPQDLLHAMKRIGRPPASDPTTVVMVRLPQSLIQALEKALVRRREEVPTATRQDLIREALLRMLPLSNGSNNM